LLRRPLAATVATLAARSVLWQRLSKAGLGANRGDPKGQVMRDDARQRATDFVKELYAAGDIDADGFDTGVGGVLAARTEDEIAEVVRSLPAPVALTSPGRRLAGPLEIHSGFGRLRLTGRWQVAAETHISADLGSIMLDLTEAEFDDRVIDLHVYSGCGNITIIVPRGVGVQVIRHRGGVDSRLDAPVPGLPLVRLDVTTNIGRVHLRHPGTQGRAKRRPAAKR
jgi:hypothetical protein